MAQTCNKCGSTDGITIPYIVHEDDMARSERLSKRLWIVILVLIVALVGSNIAWIAYESQFVAVDVNQDVEQRSGVGNNSMIGGDYNGVSESANTHQIQG